MLALKLLVMILCAGLFWWGGDSWKPARRFIMPVVLALCCAYYAHSFWALAMLSCIGAFCLGYGEKSPLKHVFGNGWGRGVWGLISASCLSAPLFLTQHLGIQVGHLALASAPWTYILLALYSSLNFILENALKDINQKLGDPLIGLGFASIVFLVQ